MTKQKIAESITRCREAQRAFNEGTATSGICHELKAYLDVDDENSNELAHLLHSCKPDDAKGTWWWPCLGDEKHTHEHNLKRVAVLDELISKLQSLTPHDTTRINRHKCSRT